MDKQRQTRSQSTGSVQIIKKSIRKHSRESSDNDSSPSPHVQKRYVKVWNQEEDKLLDKYYSEFKGNWKLIAEKIPGRNTSQCSQRWKRINPNRNKLRKQWTEDEDILVLRFIAKYGKNWKKIEEQFQGRSGKQIRERWINKLDPDINHGRFTQEEDRLIEKLFIEIGPKWSEISKNLKGRPVNINLTQLIFLQLKNYKFQENMVKNRFYSYIRKTNPNLQNAREPNQRFTSASSFESSDFEIEYQEKQFEVQKQFQNKLSTIQSVQEDSNSIPRQNPLQEYPKGSQIYMSGPYVRDNSMGRIDCLIKQDSDILRYEQYLGESFGTPKNNQLGLRINCDSFSLDRIVNNLPKMKFPFDQSPHEYLNIPMPSIDEYNQFNNDQMNLVNNEMQFMNLEK